MAVHWLGKVSCLCCDGVPETTAGRGNLLVVFVRQQKNERGLFLGWPIGAIVLRNYFLWGIFAWM